MIVPMKKIHIVAQEKDSEKTVDQLGALGAVHVEHLEAPKSDNIVSLREDIKTLSRVIDILSQIKGEESQEECPLWEKCAFDLLRTYKTIEQLKEDIIKRNMVIEELKPWGDFDPQECIALSEKGINV